MGGEALYGGGVWQPWWPARSVGAMAGGGTTGSGTPWTAQQFSAWKRREKDRLVKLRTTLSEDSLALLSYAELKVQVEETEEKVGTLTTSIADLDQRLRTSRPADWRSHQTLGVEKRLEREIAQLNVEIANRFFAGKYKEQKEEVAKLLKKAKVDSAHYVEQERLADRTREQLKSQKSLLKEAKQGLSTPLELQNAAKDLGLAKSLGRLDDVIDQRLADLDGDALPPWAVKAVTAYAEERAAAARKAEKEAAAAARKAEKEAAAAARKAEKEAAAAAWKAEKEAAAAARKVEEQRLAKKTARAAAARKAAKKVADDRKQLEKDSEELADLQRSETAMLKQIANLERRLEREKQRLLTEREFLSKKLTTKDVRKFSKQELDFAGDIFFVGGTVVVGKWVHNPNGRNWEERGPEFFPKIRAMTLKIEELKADITELKEAPKRVRALKSSIRKLEKDIATADKANAAAGGWPKGKAPRIGYIANAHAFEKYMAEWMRWLGWDDAKAMPVGPDEGIDVKATGALGQAKHWDTEVGIEEVQRHNGVCEGIQKYGRVFLSKSGYTPQAIKWANDRDLPLFEMKAGDKDAGVAASTKAGEKLLKVGAKAMKGSKRN